MRQIDADALFLRLTKICTTDDGHGMGVAEGVAKAMARILEAPTIEAEQKWIPVSERLPDSDGFYLIAIDTYGYVGIRRFYADCPEAFARGLACTHWMPLPKPPKMDGGDSNAAD